MTDGHRWIQALQERMPRSPGTFSLYARLRAELVQFASIFYQEHNRCDNGGGGGGFGDDPDGPPGSEKKDLTAKWYEFQSKIGKADPKPESPQAPVGAGRSRGRLNLAEKENPCRSFSNYVSCSAELLSGDTADIGYFLPRSLCWEVSFLACVTLGSFLVAQEWKKRPKGHSHSIRNLCQNLH